VSVGLADGDQTQQGDDAEDDQAGLEGARADEPERQRQLDPTHDREEGDRRPDAGQRQDQLHPAIATVALAAADGDLSALGAGCDEQFEFEFALDLLLDAVERLHEAGWSSGR
jgi:hypothetical protein